MSLKSASVGPNKQSVEVVRKLQTKQSKTKLCDKLIRGSLHEKSVSVSHLSPSKPADFYVQ